MMNYEDFCNYVVETVKVSLEDDTEKKVSLRDVTKNNGVKMKALVIDTKDKNIAPMIYLEPYYEQYVQEQASPESIIVGIMNAYEKASKGIFCNFNVEDLKKKNIIGGIINLNQNMDFLKDVPYIPFGQDYAVIFKCLISKDKEGYQTLTITDELAHSMGMTEQELYELALKNSPKLFPVQLKSMKEVMLGLIGSFIGEETDLSMKEVESVLGDNFMSHIDMHVLTNLQGCQGAFTILYPETQQLLAERFDCDLMVIPSSVHEWIIYPKNEWKDEEGMKEIINDVNINHVEKEEILGDKPFVLKREDDGQFIPLFPPVCTS